MKHLFWILWSAEFLFLTWMLWDEMKLKYLSLPPYLALGFVWLILSIIVKYIVKSDTAALVMVGIPAVPLGLMAIFLVIVFIISVVAGPIRWN